MNAALVKKSSFSGYKFGSFDFVIVVPDNEGDRGVIVFPSKENERIVHDLQEYWTKAILFPMTYFVFGESVWQNVVYFLQDKTGKDIEIIDIYYCLSLSEVT